MLRVTAIVVALCVVLIGASAGLIAFLAFGVPGHQAAVIGLAATTALALYNTVSARLRDRGDLGTQIADLSRGTADLARQVAELGRRVAASETEVKIAAGNLQSLTRPLAGEIAELGTLVRDLAQSVAAHDAVLREGAVAAPTNAAENFTTAPALKLVTAGGAFAGMSRDEIDAVIRSAVEENRVDLYLQPIVTLPQRKVRYYEAVTRLRNAEGTIITPPEFLVHAEASGLIGRIDNLLVFRCVQVLRRLLTKNREIGVYCNISGVTLSDAAAFGEISQFLEANRVIAPSLMLEFTQLAWREMGPLETEALSALSDRGYRFSMDHVSDLRVEPRSLVESGIRTLKIPAASLLDKTIASADIHIADLSDLLGRNGISLIAEKIEAEATVVDLLDFDVRFAQGNLFSPPRPVRADALAGPESAMAQRPAPTAASA